MPLPPLHLVIQYLLMQQYHEPAKLCSLNSPGCSVQQRKHERKPWEPQKQKGCYCLLPIIRPQVPSPELRQVNKRNLQQIIYSKFSMTCGLQKRRVRENGAHACGQWSMDTHVEAKLGNGGMTGATEQEVDPALPAGSLPAEWDVLATFLLLW